MNCYFYIYRILPNTLDEEYLEKISVEKNLYRYSSFLLYREIPDWSEYIGKFSLKGFYDRYDRWYNHVLLPQNQRIMYLPSQYKGLFDSQYIYSMNDEEQVLLVKLEREILRFNYIPGKLSSLLKKVLYLIYKLLFLSMRPLIIDIII